MKTNSSFRGLGNTRKKRIFRWCLEKNRLRHKTTFLILLIAVFFILSNASGTLLSAGDIKFIEKVKLANTPEPLQYSWAFCVTDDELVIIPDFQAGNIKIYEGNGEFLDSIGQKGYGKDEFVKPTFCFYDKVEDKLAVMDHGLRKIFIYLQMGRTDFERVNEVSCWRGADGIQLSNDRLFISGYKAGPNNEHYDFYSIDLRNNETAFLLPSYRKYGLSSPGEHARQFFENLDIPKIGIRGWFDIYRDDAYFVWEGSLKIIKLNIETGEIGPASFGTQPPHYIKPHASPELREVYRTMNTKGIENEKAKMSYVRHLFTSPKYVIVIYQGPSAQGNASNYRIQFYTLDGDFINDSPIPGQPDRRMWFDKDTYTLYSLVNKSGEGDEGYFILKYKISE